MRELSLQDSIDLCVGGTVLGTGGGGECEVGVRLVRSIYDSGKSIKLITPEEIPDDATVICSAGIGSVAPPITEDAHQIRRLRDEAISSPCQNKNPFLLGISQMEKYLNKKIYATYAFEMAGTNTATAAIAAAFSEIYFVDGDPVGRAVPEVGMNVFSANGVPAYPYVSVDVNKNTVICTKAENERIAEEISRAMAVIGHSTTITARPVIGNEFKELIIPGTVSGAIEIGKAIRTAKDSGQNIPETVIAAAGGSKLFHGTVEKKEWQDDGGFMWGSFITAGIDEYEGHKLKVWYKNENLISWLDEEPYVTAPDFICVIDAITGEGVTNTKMLEGQEVVVFAVKAAPVWYSSPYIDLMCPEHFGYNIPYSPLDNFIV